MYDTSGGIVPDASVVLHNTATNLDRTTSSNEAGAYVIPDIQPGDYDLKISKEGFKTVVQAGISLAVNQTATFDVTLSAGSITDSVTVAAEALTVEASTAELGVAVVKQQVNDLPLNGRNFTQLLNLTPGVSTINVAQNSTTGGGIWSNPVGTFSYPSINGQTNRSNLYLLDGLNNQGSFGSTYAVAPIVDAIQEFKVQSHNDDTSYGGALGGIVNVVSKSGTAQYHATLWEFVRNTTIRCAKPVSCRGNSISTKPVWRGWRRSALHTVASLRSPKDVLLRGLRGLPATHGRIQFIQCAHCCGARWRSYDGRRTCRLRARSIIRTVSFRMRAAPQDSPIHRFYAWEVIHRRT